MKSEVYNQSNCIVSNVIYKYYIENKTGTQIARELDLSSATVSRLLKRGREEGFVEIKMKEPYISCLRLEKEIKQKYDLDQVIVVPILEKECEIDVEEVKKKVALEAARYVQRTIKDGDIIGLAWSRTIYHMIQYLNPCQKVNANMVTLHGNVEIFGRRFVVDDLVKRAAMAFGGTSFSLLHKGLCESREELEEVIQQKQNKEIFDLFPRINMSITGVGVFGKKPTSLLAKAEYLKKNELDELMKQNVCSDFLLRFFNEKGKECESSMKNRTLSISADVYKKINNKVVVTCGSNRSTAVKSLLTGHMANVLIIDYYLATELVKEENEVY